MLHVLDSVTTSSGLAEAVPTSAATSGGTGPDTQVSEATSYSSVCVYHFVAVMVILILHIISGAEYLYDNAGCQ